MTGWNSSLPKSASGRFNTVKMSQRTDKVSSLIKQVIASEITHLPEAARFTVTSVEVTPDLRQATAWIGVLANTDEESDELFETAKSAQKVMQSEVAKKLKTKFVPRVTLERDMSGEYAEHITKVIRGL